MLGEPRHPCLLQLDKFLVELVYKWEGQESRRIGRAGMGTKPAAFQDLLSPRSWVTPCRPGAPSTQSHLGKGEAVAPASKHDSHLLSVWSAVKQAVETPASSQGDE